MSPEQNCGGWTLRAYTIAVGCFYLIPAQLSFILCMVKLFARGEFLPDKFYIDQVVGLQLLYKYDFIGVFSLVQMLVSICLIYGAYKKRRLYSVPWMLYAALDSLLRLGVVAWILISLVAWQQPDVSQASTVVQSNGFRVGLHAFFFVIVVAHFKYLNPRNLSKSLLAVTE